MFADHHGRKNALALGSLLMVVTCLLYAYSTQFWHFFLAKVFLGMSNAFVSGSDTALLFDSLHEDKQRSLFNKLYGRVWGMRMFGLAFGSVLAPFMPAYRAAFLVAAISALLYHCPRSFRIWANWAGSMRAWNVAHTSQFSDSTTAAE